MYFYLSLVFFFFFNDTATTEIYTLSLHDALPISARPRRTPRRGPPGTRVRRRALECLRCPRPPKPSCARRSEEHTSELQSLAYLVCRLLLEKKKISQMPPDSAGHQLCQPNAPVLP